MSNILSLIKYTVPAMLVWFWAYAMTPSYTPEQIAEKQNKEAIETCIKSISYKDSYNQIKRAIEICKDKEIIKVITPWTASGAIVPQASQRNSYEEINLWSELETIYDNVCKMQINSPLCKDKALFGRLYIITEKRLPWKNFYPILLGISNAESSLWLNYAKDNTWWTCAWRNNWGGIKWKIQDDWTRVKDQKVPDQFNCYLYKFDSIEDYWISKVNTIRFWYKSCIDSKTPVRCISWAYVWDRNVQEQSWINNVSIFL